MFMSRHRIRMCSNPDCRDFSEETRNTRCKRCGLETLTRAEFTRYFELDKPMSRLNDDWPMLDDEIDVGKLSKPNGKANGKVTDSFSCPDLITGCPIATPVSVFVPQEMFDQWVYLARHLETEWIGYIVGSVRGSDYVLEDTYFPNQSANSIHVGVTGERQVKAGTIAAVHSHVDMQVFFSDEDKKHLNHPVELIVNRKAEIIASVQTKLKCGELARSSAKVMLVGNDMHAEALKELKSKLVEKKIIQQMPLQDKKLVDFNYIKN